MAAINRLTEAQYSLIRENNSTRLSEEEINPECAHPQDDLGLPIIPGVTPSPNCVQRRSRRASLQEDVEIEFGSTNRMLAIFIQNIAYSYSLYSYKDDHIVHVSLSTCSA